MPNVVSTSLSDTLADATSTLGDRVADKAIDFNANVSELGRKAADAIDENMASAATGLDKAAATLHGRAERLPGMERVSGLAHTTADKLGATADYLRAHDVDRIMKDTKGLVRNHPGPSLLVAGAIGFLLGRTLIGRRRG